MTILGIIITIIILIAVKFFYENSQQSSKLKSEGGIRKKYSILIDYLLSGDPKCRVFKETNTYICVGVNGMGGSQVFHIYPTFGKVTVELEVKNNPLMGNMKKEWTFPENMNQEEMAMKINSDMEELMKNFYKNFGTWDL